MARHERIKRPKPERTHPIRSWGTVFGTEESPPAADAPAAKPPADDDPITKGVQSGYRVIEDYVRQGQSAARVMWGPMLGGANAVPSGEDMQQRFGTVVRTATDLATLWLDFLGTTPWGASRAAAGTPGRPAPRPGASPIPSFSNGQAAQANPAPSAPAPEPSTQPAPAIISVDVACSRRTEVIVDLRPNSARLALRAHDLRPIKGDGPRLTGITLECAPDEERVSVRLRIPDKHPAGQYSGLILDEGTSLPRGTLTVRVFANGKP